MCTFASFDYMYIAQEVLDAVSSNAASTITLGADNAPKIK
jgi:hypothetical protein